MPLTNIRGLFWRGTPLVSRHYSMLKRFRNVRQHRYQVIHTARNFTTIGSIIRVIGRVAKLRFVIHERNIYVTKKRGVHYKLYIENVMNAF